MTEGGRPVRDPSLVDAVVPLVTLAVLIAGSLALFGLDALDGPLQVALVLCAMVAALIALKNGHTWEEVQRAGQGALSSILTAQMVEVDVHEHVKRQAWTSIPAFLIALVVFLIIGLVRGPEVHDTVATTVELTKQAAGSGQASVPGQAVLDERDGDRPCGPTPGRRTSAPRQARW